MKDKIARLIDEFVTKYAKMPNVIILGRKEYKDAFRDIMFENLDIRNKTIMGIDVIETNRESYLKVGYVEG